MGILKAAKKKVEEIKSGQSLKEQQEKQLKELESKIEEKKPLVVSPPLTGSEKKGDCVTVEVGPVWSHVDFLARKEQGEFDNLLGSNWKLTGHWWTTVPGSMSVVQFALHDEEKVVEEKVIEEKKTLVVSPEITGSEKKGDCVTVEVGPILSHKDFLARNELGEFKDLLGSEWKMTGHWWTTVAGKMAVVQFTKNGEEEKPQEILKEEKPQEIKKAVHYGVICDVCDKIIVGTRFKSFHHPDYDLCEKCEPYHHREHLMIRITEPQVLTQAMRGNNLVELDMFVPNYGMGLPNIHAPNYGMELPTMQMRQCPFRRQNKPKTPEKKAPVFKVVGINDNLCGHRGFVNATWEDVEANMQAVKDAVKHIEWGIIKVENGSFDGPGYENRHRKLDNRPLGHKLIVEKKGENNCEGFRRCRGRLPHIIKKMSEGLKKLNEHVKNEKDKKAEEEQIKNSIAETQETKETEIIEEFDVPEEKPEEEKELLGEKVLEEKIEEKKDEEEKKPDLSSFIKDLNGFSAEGDIKKVSDHLKNTFENPENGKNIFSEIFSSGDKFGEAIKGFFDFVGNCKQNKDKIQQQCEEMKKQQEEDSLYGEGEKSLISDVQEETNVEKLDSLVLEKIAYLQEMFPQYPENLMKDLVTKNPAKSLSDLIDLIVAEQFY